MVLLIGDEIGLSLGEEIGRVVTHRQRHQTA